MMNLVEDILITKINQIRKEQHIQGIYFFTFYIGINSVVWIILGFYTGFTKKICFALKSSWFHPDMFEIRMDFGLIFPAILT